MTFAQLALARRRGFRPPLASIKLTMRSSPLALPEIGHDNTAVPPRMRLASVSIFSSECADNGAQRSILLMTRRSDRVMPGPPLEGNSCRLPRRRSRKSSRSASSGEEGGGEIVAAGFDQHHVEVRKFGAHVGDRGEIHRGVLAYCGMRASAGLDAGRCDPASASPERTRNSASHLGVDVVV